MGARLGVTFPDKVTATWSQDICTQDPRSLSHKHLCPASALAGVAAFRPPMLYWCVSECRAPVSSVCSLRLSSQLDGNFGPCTSRLWHALLDGSPEPCAIRLWHAVLHGNCGACTIRLWPAVQVQRSSAVFEQLHTRRCSMLLAYSSNRSSVLPPGQARLALKQVCSPVQAWCIGWSA